MQEEGGNPTSCAALTGGSGYGSVSGGEGPARSRGALTLASSASATPVVPMVDEMILGMVIDHGSNGLFVV